MMTTTDKYACLITEREKALVLESKELFGERYEVRIKTDAEKRVQVRVLVGRMIAVGNGDTKAEAFEGALDDFTQTFKREIFAVRAAYDAFLDDYIDKMLHLGKYETDTKQE